MGISEQTLAEHSDQESRPPHALEKSSGLLARPSLWRSLRTVVAFVFLLVGLLFTAALAFAVGRVGGLRWIVLLRRRRGALGILFLMRCRRRWLRRLVFAPQEKVRTAGPVSADVSAHSRAAESSSIGELKFESGQRASGVCASKHLAA
jgi:hypothetical protein